MIIFIFKFIGLIGTVPPNINILIDLTAIALALAWLFYDRWSKDYIEVLKQGLLETGEKSEGVQGLLYDLENPRDRQSAYLKKLKALLNWSQRYWGEVKRFKQPQRTRWREWFSFNAWTTQSYEFSLHLAFLYPFISVFLFWSIGGENTTGIDGLFPVGFEGWQRAITLAGFTLAIWMWYLYGPTSGTKQYAYLAVALAVAFAVGGAVGGAVAFAGAGAVGIALGGELGGAVGGALGGVVGGAFAVAFAGAGAVAIAFAVAFGGAFAVAVAFAFTVAFAVLILELRADKNRWLGCFYLGHGLFFVTLIYAVGWFFPLLPSQNFSAIWFLLLFMVLLPLLNAAFDWLSIGVTRSLLTTTLEKKGAGAGWRSLLDLGLAMLSLLLLALTITGILQTLNFLAVVGGGQPVFDLVGLLDNLRKALDDASIAPSLWWVYLTLFSTLLPTIVHGFAGVYSLLGWTFTRSRRVQFISDIKNGTAIGEGNYLASIEIARAFARRDVLAGLLTFFGSLFFIAILLWGLPGIARALLSACEWLAQLLGANVTPGPVLPMIAPYVTQWLV